MAWVVLALAVLGVVACALLLQVAWTRRRIPAAAWLLLPLAVLVGGAAGAWHGAGLARAGLGWASADEFRSMASVGYAVAQYPDRLALLLGGALFSLTALGLGGVIAASGGVAGARRRPVLAGVTCALTLAAWAGVSVWLRFTEPELGWGLAQGALLVGGLGCAGAAFRLGHDEADLRHAAGTRLLVGVCAVAGVGCAVAHGRLMGDLQIHLALASGEPGMMAWFSIQGQAMAQAWGELGGVVVPAMALVALVPVAPLARRLVHLRGLVGGLLVVVLVAPAVGFGVAADHRLDEVRSWTIRAEIRARAEHSADLPHAGLPERFGPPQVIDWGGEWELKPAPGGWAPIHPLPGHVPTFPLQRGFPQGLYLPGDYAASALLAAAVELGGRVIVQVRLDPDEPASARGWPINQGGVRFELVSAGGTPRDPHMYDEVFDATVHRHVVQERAGVDEVAGLLGLEDHRRSQLVLVPGESWTVQDVVTLCLVARAQAGQQPVLDRQRWVDCVLAEEAPVGVPVDQEAPVEGGRSGEDLPDDAVEPVEP